MKAYVPPTKSELAAARRRASKCKNDLARSRALAYRDGLQSEVDELIGKRNALRKMLVSDEQAACLKLGAVLTECEIVESSQPWGGVPGVYFLICKDRIVYVGQSVNVFARIPQHRDKEFDRFTFIQCQPDDLDALEALYINLLKPPLNIAFPAAGLTIDSIRHRKPKGD